MIQYLRKQEQTKSTTDGGVGKLQSQSIKQIQSQISQLQKQVSRIQNEIRRIDTAPTARAGTKTRFRKRVYIATAKPRSKKSKLSKSIKVKKGRKGR